MVATEVIAAFRASARELVFPAHCRHIQSIYALNFNYPSNKHYKQLNLPVTGQPTYPLRTTFSLGLVAPAYFHAPTQETLWVHLWFQVVVG